VPVYRGDGKDAVKVAKRVHPGGHRHLNDIVIIDTAGRLQIDEEMMQEAVDIKQAVKPDQILMVVDAMTGQDIVNVVQTFAERVDFDGVIMSKLDGDARGGGALSVRAVTGKPIKFISWARSPTRSRSSTPTAWPSASWAWATWYGIIEQAQKVADQEQIEAAERMLREGFTMDDCSTRCSRSARWAAWPRSSRRCLAASARWHSRAAWTRARLGASRR
jgi:signal recognition particle subunit SRP54